MARGGTSQLAASLKCLQACLLLTVLLGKAGEEVAREWASRDHEAWLVHFDSEHDLKSEVSSLRPKLVVVVKWVQPNEKEGRQLVAG